MTDYNWIGRSDAQRLADLHPDWQVTYVPARDTFRFLHIPTGQDCELDAWELANTKTAMTQVQLKNRMLELAQLKILAKMNEGLGL